jgi:hypothetical protein
MRVLAPDDLEMLARPTREELAVVGAGVAAITHIPSLNACLHGVFQKFDLRRIGFNDLVSVRLATMFLKR